MRRYLREFLSDPRVIDINPLARALLLNLIILPVRPRRSAAAYEKVWTDRGSPLLVHSQDLTEAVQKRLGPGWCVRLGMRYGNPPLREALLSLVDKVERLVVLPLYPQQASSSTGSSLHAVFESLLQLPTAPPLCIVEPFFDDPGFIDGIAARGAPILAAEKPDHVLFSFHGLPERQIKKSDPSGSFCLARPDCCAKLLPQNRGCYRAECYATARLLAERLSATQAELQILDDVAHYPPLEAPDGDVPDGGVVVVNGRVAGVAGDFAEDGDHVTFNALISEEILQQGANDVVLLVPRRSGSRQFETASLE